MEQKHIIAIEIGSSKIKGALGSIDENGSLSVLAVKEERIVDSVRYGCIQNVDVMGNAVSQIVSSLESVPGIAPRKVKGVYVGIGGRSLSSTLVEESMTLPEETEITELIIDQIKEKVKATAIPERDIIDVLPCKYMVDKQAVSNPVGVFGQKLTAKMNIISCKPQIKRNINRLLSERLQLAINGNIVRQVAIADVVLTDNEKRLGCMLVDFGAETTTVSIYKDGVLQYLATLPLGSRNITRDITATNCIEERAEEIKKVHGCAIVEPVSDGKKTTIDGIDTIEVNNYVQARASEIVANIIAQLNYAGYKPSELPQGFVVVGGGAKLRGFNTLLETNSAMKVRSGAPVGMIRVIDPCIQSNEAVDVLAVLMAAARCNPVECLEKPAVTETDEAETDEPEEAEVSVVDTPSVSERRSLLKWLKYKTVRLVTENAVDEDDDNFEDDEK